MNIALAK